MRRTRAWPGREAWNEEDHKGLSWAGSPARGRKAQQQQPPLLLLQFNQRGQGQTAAGNCSPARRRSMGSYFLGFRFDLIPPPPPPA